MPTWKQTDTVIPSSIPSTFLRTHAPRLLTSPASAVRRALASPTDPRPPPSASPAERRPPLSPRPPSAASPRQRALPAPASLARQRRLPLSPRPPSAASPPRATETYPICPPAIETCWLTLEIPIVDCEPWLSLPPPPSRVS
ncbi:hypothetical protein BDA96_10G000300 [Sorghum bicolor]|uniref:Uncharacterized protein n=1 Tax=Sorghum bicolor TaxID=4558 RepID=A0A921Q0U2_SORBI|nr:hypothetical protein BDA96_10G000300 [Sorghum bicolor]